MKINRRCAVGQLLLGGVVATGVIGCAADKESTLRGDTAVNIVVDSAVTGNLMPPTEIELCVDVNPDSAALSITGAVDGDGTMMDGGCETNYGYMMMTITATAEGYEDHQEEQHFGEDTLHMIVMNPISNSEGSYTDGLSPKNVNCAPQKQTVDGSFVQSRLRTKNCFESSDLFS